MMNDAGRNVMSYRVICTWCGVTIRHNNTRESSGMCQSCYARMFSEHTRPYQRAGKELKASER